MRLLKGLYNNHLFLIFNNIHILILLNFYINSVLSSTIQNNICFQALGLKNDQIIQRNLEQIRALNNFKLYLVDITRNKCYYALKLLYRNLSMYLGNLQLCIITFLTFYILVGEHHLSNQISDQYSCICGFIVIHLFCGKPRLKIK